MGSRNWMPRNRPPASIGPATLLSGAGPPREGTVPCLHYRQEGQPYPAPAISWHNCQGGSSPSPSTGSATCPHLLQGCCQQLPQLCWELVRPPPLGKDVCRWESCQGCRGPEAPPQQSRRPSCTRHRAAFCLLTHVRASPDRGARGSWVLHRVGWLCHGSWH